MVVQTAEVMSDNLLSNIIVLDVSKQSEYFNYFIIATGLTSQHLESSGNTITKHLKDLKIKINHKEGLSNGGWVLLDYPGLVIHLFLEDQRNNYDLEGLWSDSYEILNIL
ncbi:MAG: ribosome silencing factor [Dehalococcoidia bacterium]|nr:ribosome silencing factor [Dehalococcoidia bacterium]